jgi:hypothetical protein
MASKALAPEDIHKFFKFCLDALRKGVPLPSTTNQFGETLQNVLSSQWALFERNC